MSPQPAVESSPTNQPSGREQRPASPITRLEELRRSLQRRLRRKPNAFEKAARDRAATLMLRAEQAARDPKCTLNDIVRLQNCARRATTDFERIAVASRPESPAAPAARLSRVTRRRIVAVLNGDAA